MCHERPEPHTPQTAIDMQGVEMMLDKTSDFSHNNDISNKHAFVAVAEPLNQNKIEIKFFSS